MSINLNVGGGGATGPVGMAGAGCRSIFGMVFGVFLIPAAFGIVYYGEIKLVNHGVVFERTPYTAPDAAAGMDGQLVRTKGQPKGEFLVAPRYRAGKVVYWRRLVEEYEEHTDSEGDRSYSWDTKDSESKWAPFTIGPLKIQPDKANPVGEETVFRGFKRRYASDFDPSKWDTSPSVGDQRMTVQVLKPGKDYFILGQAQSQAISGGSSFVVSALDEAGTIATLKTEYQIAYWLIKVGAIVALWIGMMSLFGPLMTLVGWIPWLGERLSGALAFMLLVFAAVVVGLLTLLFKLFWFILVVAVGLIVFLIIQGLRSPRQRPARWEPLRPA